MGTFTTSEPVVGTNGDVITNADLREVVAQHVRSGAIATDVLAPLRSQYGIAELDDSNFICGFQEKPMLPYWLNAGIYVFDPTIRDLLPERGDHEDTTFPRLAAQHKLLGFPTHAYWRAVDTVKDITDLQRELEGHDLDALVMT